MNLWLIFIIFIIIAGYLLECVTSLLTIKALLPEIPYEFKDIFDPTEYVKSQEYTKAKTGLSLISSTVTTLFTLAFILLGGFNIVDQLARSLGFGPVLTGIIFTAILLSLTFVLGLPFTIYSTFVIEERFAFNRTTPGTFILDIIKTILLAILLGVPLLALILWFFEATGTNAWLYCWLAVVTFTVLVQFIAPVVILPLFNKFSPLKEGELKQHILAYAEKEHFHLKGIFTMDGSKRSTKLNAFFTGFGRFRKIVFYDTLLSKLNNKEIIAVLAHEMGHFKKKHIIKMMAASMVQTGFIFYLLSLLLNNNELFAAMRMDHVSVYASIVFFGIIFTPVNAIVSVVFYHFSRKHEYEADAYATLSSDDGEALVSGLKKLCQANLSNLTPHPVVVFLEYSHPPVLQRIEAIRNIR